MKNKETLMSMKVDELRKVASKLGVKSIRSYKKEGLVEAILRAESESAIEEQSAKDENEIENKSEEVVAKKEETAITKERKMSYVESLSAGALIAFVLPDGKTKSAKVTRKSTKNKKLEVETEYGATYIINYNDVIWVRTGKRWPRGVYNMLKGIENEPCRKD